MPLGPGAEEFEDLCSANATSDGRTGGASLNAGIIMGGGGRGIGGKRSSRSVL